jgi:hypothetical protein
VRLGCGSAVLATLTGETVTRVEAVLLDMGVDPAATRAIDLRDVFSRFGIVMSCVAIWDAPGSARCSASGWRGSRWLGVNGIR